MPVLSYVERQRSAAPDYVQSVAVTANIREHSPRTRVRARRTVNFVNFRGAHYVTVHAILRPHCRSNTSTWLNFSPFRLVPSSVMVSTLPSAETLRIAMPTILPSRFSSDFTVRASTGTALSVS